MNVPGRAVRRRAIVEKFGQKAFDQVKNAGSIVAVVKGVYAHRDHATTVETRIAAANQWLSARDAVGGLAACVVHGLEVRRLRRITVVRAAARSARPESWMRLRRLTASLPTSVTSGIRVVSLECALVQVWWDEGDAVGKGLILDAIRDKRTTAPKIRIALGLFPRMRQRAALTQFLEHLHGGIQSYLEYVADRDILNAPDLASMIKQREFWIAGVHYIVDLFDERTQTALELDGTRYHNSDRARRRDLAKDVALATIGVLVVRFTFEDITRRPEWCQGRIRQILATRGRS